MALGADEAPAAESDGAEHAPAYPTLVGVPIVANDGVAENTEVDDTQWTPWLVDVKHDRDAREGIIAQMVAGEHEYTSEEDSMLQRMLDVLVANSSHAANSVNRGSTIESRWTNVEKGTGKLVGNVRLVIRGASPLAVIAHIMNANSRHAQKAMDPRIEVRLEIRAVMNAHRTIILYECKSPPFQNRIFLNAMVWKKMSDTQYICCIYPIASHPSVTPSDERHAVRAEGTRFFRFTHIAEGITNVEYFCMMDLKGRFPAFLTNKVIPTLMIQPHDSAIATSLWLRPYCSTLPRQSAPIVVSTYLEWRAGSPAHFNGFAVQLAKVLRPDPAD